MRLPQVEAGLPAVIQPRSSAVTATVTPPTRTDRQRVLETVDVIGARNEGDPKWDHEYAWGELDYRHAPRRVMASIITAENRMRLARHPSSANALSICEESPRVRFQAKHTPATGRFRDRLPCSTIPAITWTGQNAVTEAMVLSPRRWLDRIEPIPAGA